jgi:tetratricopeptide (TPR) repeat protein
VNLQKLERNKQLLERRIDADPLDITAWVYLGEERYRLGDIDGSKLAIDIAWEQFADQYMVHCTGNGTLRISKMLLRTFMEKASVARMLVEVQQNRFEEAMEIVRRCDQWGVTNPTLEYLSAACFERFSLQARNPAKRRVWLLAALEKLKSCLHQRNELRAIAALEGMTSWRASNKLGEIFLQLGEPERALEMFDLAIELREDFVEPRIGRCEALLDQGRRAEAMGELQALPRVECADIPLLIGVALRQAGKPVEADAYIDQAYKRVRTGILAAYRAVRLNAIIQEGRPVLA